MIPPDPVPEPHDEGNPSPGRVVTMKDIAAAVGITPAAVSLALKNHPSISEARRNEVRAAAERLGYRPNAMAAALAHHRHQSRVHPMQAEIALINSYPNPEQLRTQPSFIDCFRGASQAAEKFGYRLEEFPVDASHSLKSLERIFLARNIRGIILGPLPPKKTGVKWESFSWHKFSAVRCGFREHSPPLHYVTSAQATNTMLAFDRMRSLGYQRIAFAGYWDKARMFGAGFLWSQQEPGLHNPVPPFFFSRHSEERNQQTRFNQWLEQQQPDGILTDSLAVPDMLERAGRRVPDDIGLAATNVRDMSVDAGIDQNPVEIGRLTTLSLISLIHDGDLGIPDSIREILVRGKWVDGSSLPAR